MSYTPTQWQNDTAPAISAENLNKIENGISNAHNELDKVATTSQLGRVKVDGTTVTADNDGTIHAVGGGGGGGTWGSITGTLSNQTDLQTALDTKEATSNKVTSWSASTSNTKYPSEKLVKDSLDDKANSTHSHVISDVTDLQDALDEKATFISLTQAQYDALPSSQKLDPDTYYIITDAFDIGNITIVDNLQSTSANSCLSANQGRVLYGMIGDIDDALDAINGEVI